MITVDKSVEINRPVEAVFAYIMDIRNDVHWQTGVVDVSIDRPMQAGAKLRSVRKFLGMRIEGLAEVVEYQPNAKRITKGVGGPFQVTATQIFERNGDGTRLTFHAVAELTGLLRLVDGIVANELNKMITEYLTNLKNLLE